MGKVEVTLTVDTEQSFGAAITELRRALSLQMSDDEASDNLFLVTFWQPNIELEANQLVRFRNIIYRSVKAHTTQSDWTPPDTRSLFTPIGADEEIASGAPPWVQPAGGHDAYMRGARVTHNGYVWESTHDNNVWAPGVFGWTKVTG